MKYNHDEYEEMVLQLNMSKSKKIIVIGSLVAAVIVFVTILLMYKEVGFALVLSVLGLIASYFFSKKAVADSAKKANLIKNIKSIEQTIFEDKIVEVVTSVDNLESVGEYYYKDIAFVKEDDNNYYLYLNSNAAVIISKRKIENINDFKEILIKNNLLK